LRNLFKKRPLNSNRPPPKPNIEALVGSGTAGAETTPGVKLRTKPLKTLAVSNEN
jgi:hypothetical protein